MSRIISLYLEPNEAGEYPWAILDGDQVAPQTPMALADIARTTESLQALVVIDGLRVRMTQVDIPRRNRQRALASIPYMVEEQLAADVERCHFAHKLTDGERARVAIVDREQMRLWMDSINAAGLRVKAMIPAQLALRAEEGSDAWSVIQWRDRVLLREENGNVSVLDPASLAFTLYRKLRERGEEPSSPVPLYVFRCPDSSSLPLDELHMEDFALREVGENGSLNCIWPWRQQEPMLDLRQGEFSRDDQGDAWVKPWIPAVATALLSLLLWALIQWTHIDALKTDIQQTRDAIEALFKQNFPEAKRIVNARAQTEHRLRELRGATQESRAEFLDTLGAIGPTIAAARDIELTRMNYSPSSADLEVRATNLQALDAFKESLQASGLGTVDIESAAAGQQGVVSRLKIDLESSQ